MNKARPNKAQLGLACFAALTLLGWAQAWAGDDGPDATVRRAYAATKRELANLDRAEPPWRPPYRDKLMSKRLAGLFARDDQFVEESGDEGNLGSDPFISGQAGGVGKLKVTIGSRQGDKAIVFADFRSLGERIRVEFSMVRQDGRWVIDDIVDTMDKQRVSVADQLSQPYDCGSFMNKPCKR